MKINTSEQYDDSLYIIATDNLVGITNMSFISKECSIKEYEKWYGGVLKNVLPISDFSMSPQYIHISSINELQDIILLAQDELNKSKLNEENVLVPFFGGVKNDVFRNLLNRLWDIEEDKFYQYVSETRSYYKGLFEELKNER